MRSSSPQLSARTTYTSVSKVTHGSGSSPCAATDCLMPCRHIDCVDGAGRCRLCAQFPGSRGMFGGLAVHIGSTTTYEQHRSVVVSITGMQLLTTRKKRHRVYRPHHTSGQRHQSQPQASFAQATCLNHNLVSLRKLKGLSKHLPGRRQ